MDIDRRFEDWMRTLEERHLADLKFSQVSSALRALSSAYVERRERLREGAALDGAGKRAAFALFYGPLHYMLVREIIRSLGERTGWDGGGTGAANRTLVDLGCGTGAAGAAWATRFQHPPTVLGIDRHPWAVEQAADTYRAFGLQARTRRMDVAAAPFPKGPGLIVAAYTLNEMDEAGRDGLIRRLLERAAGGDRVLIVEPIARGMARWWEPWRTQVEAAGGRGDEWRFHVELPPIVAKLDRAVGLNHRELKGRSLIIGPA